MDEMLQLESAQWISRPHVFVAYTCDVTSQYVYSNGESSFAVHYYNKIRNNNNK